MNITKEKNYTLIKPETATTFTDLFKEFNNKISQYLEDQIILDLTNLTLSEIEISQFQNISEKKVGLGTSFVVIYVEVDLDLIPDELVVVPTFQEAIDVIEMDEMTRSLDF